MKSAGSGQNRNETVSGVNVSLGPGIQGHRTPGEAMEEQSLSRHSSQVSLQRFCVLSGWNASQRHFLD
ncbi:hypothetical protein RISK_003072 [Rhodopirellula islandica]|uniref:Uncharacterized protein n=1 Tax=Rhodopirellula islandica TaxID=595434 RepID=A0A0J1EGY2_RHOIS|nr:hypothetical protein RISK_003072 [Rhodopirellula islandica]